MSNRAKTKKPSRQKEALYKKQRWQLVMALGDGRGICFREEYEVEEEQRQQQLAVVALEKV